MAPVPFLWLIGRGRRKKDGDMTKSSKRTAAVPPQAGWAELAEGRWAAARAAFRAVLEAEETPEALEGLSWAAWWLDDAETVFEAREHAFRLYSKRGDSAS